jgi:hypothetical protein
MSITISELGWLNFYRASELHGGLVLGQLAQRTRDPWLMEQLTRHSAEEVMHAELWTTTIREVGGAPRHVRRTYQKRYAEAIGAPVSVFQVLVLTQVFERRVYRHFIEHEKRPGTHARVRATLQRMIEEEKSHLSWVKDWLDAQAAARGHDLDGLMRLYRAVDQRIYAELADEYGYRKAA